MRNELWPHIGLDAMDDDMDGWLARPDVVVLVAERPEGGLCGFAEVGTRDYGEGCETSPVAYLEGWYVDSDVQRRGVGRALVAAAERWAVERGLRELASDAELDNDGSIAAHLALGFEEVERAVHFRKPLADAPSAS